MVFWGRIAGRENEGGTTQASFKTQKTIMIILGWYLAQRYTANVTTEWTWTSRDWDNKLLTINNKVSMVLQNVLVQHFGSFDKKFHGSNISRYVDDLDFVTKEVLDISWVLWKHHVN